MTIIIQTVQAFVDVTDNTANVNFILSMIQRKWGNEMVLVASDGLKLTMHL